VLAALTPAGENGVLVSFGAAAYGPAVSSSALLLRAADAALYRAKRSGGGQIWTAGQPGEPAEERARRHLRRTLPNRMRGAVQDLAERFEGELAEKGPYERIEAMAVTLAEALNAAAWAISAAPAGGQAIRTITHADGRDQRLKGLRLEVDDVYEIDEYPATARLIRAGAGAFVSRVGDEHADPAESALLEELGMRCVIAAAAADDERTWLLEIYGDDETAPLEDAVLECGLLMRAAMPPRPAGTPLARRTRQLGLMNAVAGRLAAASSSAEITAAVAEELYSAMGVSATGVMRLRPGGEDHPGRVLDMASGLGLFCDRYFLGFAQPAHRGLVGRCLREGRAVLAEDVAAEPDYFSTPATREVRSELDVPVRLGGHAWGAITVQDLRPAAFDEEDAGVLASVADQMATALRSAPLLNEVHALAPARRAG
jgi:GAF domain